MAINPHMFLWFEELDAKWRIFKGARIADLGPQDLSNTGGLQSVRLRFPDWTGQDLYRHLGCKTYTSFDLFDSRSVNVDLNDPPSGRPDFDIVTNFGTSEHVVNQASVFRFMHELTAVNGVMLHSIPAAGGRDHGFFNYHPGLFFDLAAANRYEVLHFEYFPHYDLQAPIATSKVSVDISHRADSQRFTDEAAIKKATFRLFLRRHVMMINLRLLISCLRRRNVGPFFDTYRNGDYIHVALRKTSEGKFEMPIQKVYQTKS